MALFKCLVIRDTCAKYESNMSEDTSYTEMWQKQELCLKRDFTVSFLIMEKLPIFMILKSRNSGEY